MCGWAALTRDASSRRVERSRAQAPLIPDSSTPTLHVYIHYIILVTHIKISIPTEEVTRIHYPRNVSDNNNKQYRNNRIS